MALRKLTGGARSMRQVSSDTATDPSVATSLSLAPRSNPSSRNASPSRSRSLTSHAYSGSSSSGSGSSLSTSSPSHLSLSSSPTSSPQLSSAALRDRHAAVYRALILSLARPQALRTKGLLVQVPREPASATAHLESLLTDLHSVHLDELPPLEVGLIFRRFLLKHQYPMFTTFMYPAVLAAMSIPSSEERPKALARILHALPAENLGVVKSLLQLLSLVAINSENEVVPLMLAMGYAPLLIRDSEIVVEEASKPVVAATEILISNFDYFFLNQPLKLCNSTSDASTTPEQSFMQRHEKMEAFHVALESATKAFASKNNPQLPYTLLNAPSIRLTAQAKPARESSKGRLRKRSTKGKGHDLSQIPLTVELCLKFLKSAEFDKLPTQDEWLFLASPDPVQLKALRRRVAKRKGFDKEGLATLGCTAVDVGGLLMVFFEELENPLLTIELHDCWLAAVGIVDMQARLLCLKKVIDLLPPVNAATLLELVDFFSIVIQVNKALNLKKIAEKFAPLLLRPLDSNGDVVPVSHPSVRNRASTRVIEHLVEFIDFLFYDKPLYLPSNVVEEYSSGLSSTSSRALKREASKIFDEQYKCATWVLEQTKLLVDQEHPPLEVDPQQLRREKRATRNRLSMFLEEMCALPSSPLAHQSGATDQFSALERDLEDLDLGADTFESQQPSTMVRTSGRNKHLDEEGEADETGEDADEPDAEQLNGPEDECAPVHTEEERKQREIETALLSANAICERAGRYRCRLCQKLFMGESFVHKHIRLRHPTLFTDVDASLEVVALRDMLKEAKERELANERELTTLRAQVKLQRAQLQEMESMLDDVKIEHKEERIFWMSKLENAQAKLREQTRPPSQASTSSPTSSPRPCRLSSSGTVSSSPMTSPQVEAGTATPHGRFSSTAALIEFFNRQNARIRTEALTTRQRQQHGPPPPRPLRRK